MAGVVVLGSTGMLGHKLVDTFAAHGGTIAIARRAPPGEVQPDVTLDLTDFDALSRILRRLRPETIVNAAGIVKQRPAAPSDMAAINAELPRHLAAVSAEFGARMIHLSTDCVYSGRRGLYVEEDRPDPVDDYGLSKLRGEVTAPHVMVLRTSMVGLERRHFTGLVEWFLRQRGAVRGFTKAVFSGLSTTELSRVILSACQGEWFRPGVWHVAARPISKHDLLDGLAERLGRGDVHILRDESVRCDRSLSGARFEEATGFRPPGWEEMLDGLAGEIRRRESVVHGG